MSDRPWEDTDPIVGENLLPFALPPLQQQESAPNPQRPWETSDPIVEILPQRQLSQRQGAPTLGGNVPTIEQVEENRARGRATLAANQRFQNLPRERQDRAAARNFVGNIPVVRSIPGVSGYANPPGGSQEALELQDYRSSYPVDAATGRFVSRALPYVAAGSAIPQLLSTLPRAAIFGGGLESLSAAAEGEPVLHAAVSGAASAIPGAIAGKLITPRSPQGAFNARWNRATDQVRYWKAPGRRFVADSARAFSTARDPAVRTLIGEAEGDASIEGIRKILGDLLVTEHSAPFRSIPHVPPSVAAGSGVIGGVIANIATQGSIPHIVGGALAGTVAPEVARRVINVPIHGLNRFLRNTPTGRALGSDMYNYSTNQLLSPQARAIIEALIMPAAQEYAGPSQVPNLLGQ